MLLAVDTATRWTGLALYDGHNLIAEQGWQGHRTQTVELAPALTQMLAQARLDVSVLKAIGVAIGPGSYTGLRVGLSLVKGLVLAQGMPLIGIPTLDIVAAGVPGGDGTLVVTAEAGRRRIWAGFFRWQRRYGWQLTPPPNEAEPAYPITTEWDDLLPRCPAGTLFAGEISADAARQIRTAGQKFQLLLGADGRRRAGYLAALAWRRYSRGDLDDPATLAPNYVRRPTGA